MASKKKLLTRQEVAGILGVTPQTVSNLVSRGILRYSKTNKTMFSSQAVDAMLDQTSEIIEMERMAEEYRESLRKELDAYKKERAEVEELVGIKTPSESVSANLFRSLAGVYLTEFRQGRTYLEAYLSGQTSRDIADKYRVTTSTVINYINQCVRLLEDARPYHEVTEENDYLRNENVMLREQLECLRKEVSEYEVRLRVAAAAEASVADTEITPDDLELYEKLKMQVKDLDSSTRFQSACRRADIETLADLVRWSKCEFIKIRDCGKKTLTEGDELLEALGLRFGMTEDVERLNRKMAMRFNG